MNCYPKLHVILGHKGVERVEIWGRRADEEEAMQLYFRLGPKIEELSRACSGAETVLRP